MFIKELKNKRLPSLIPQPPTDKGRVAKISDMGKIKNKFINSCKVKLFRKHIKINKIADEV